MFRVGLYYVCSEFVGVANQTVPPSLSDDHTTSPERIGVHLTLDVLPQLLGVLNQEPPGFTLPSKGQSRDMENVRLAEA